MQISSAEYSQPDIQCTVKKSRQAHNIHHLNRKKNILSEYMVAPPVTMSLWPRIGKSRSNYPKITKTCCQALYNTYLELQKDTFYNIWYPLIPYLSLGHHDLESSKCRSNDQRRHIPKYQIEMLCQVNGNQMQPYARVNFPVYYTVLA